MNRRELAHLTLTPYWVTLLDWVRTESCPGIRTRCVTVYADGPLGAKLTAERITGVKVKLVAELPRAAEPVLFEPDNAPPAFCHSPGFCAEHGHCPGHRSCCE